MAGPNILNAGNDNTQANTDTTFYELTSVSVVHGNNAVTATAPATTKTAIVLIAVDVDNSSTLTIDDPITWGSLPRIADLQYDPDTTGVDTVRVARAAIFDLSGEGAVSASLSFNVSETSVANAVISVVCTDGFVQSALLQSVTAKNAIYNRSYTPNADSCGLLNMVIFDGSQTMTAQTGTELFEDTSTTGISGTAYYQSSATNNQHEIEFVASGSNDCVCLDAILTTQVDPFDGITGKLTSPVVK